MTLDDVMDKVAAFAVSVARLSYDATNEAQDQAFEVRDEIRAAILAFAAEQVAAERSAGREGWRYADELEQERVRLVAALAAEREACAALADELHEDGADSGYFAVAIRARAQEEK